MTEQAKMCRWLPLMTAVLAPFVLIGCAGSLSAAPENRLAQKLETPAAAEISGRGAIISGPGYIHSCQDGGVFLIPATSDWESWAKQAIGKSRPASVSLVGMRQLPVDGRAWSAARHADCDNSGRFKFSDVADGKYYVLANVSWLLRWQHNGGALIQAIDVTDHAGHTVELVQDLRKTGS
jgi:hypothetical protein